MRWIFLLLLIGNLLLFVLIYQSGNGQDVLQDNAPVGQLDVMPLSEYQQGGRGFGPDEAQQAAGVNSQEQECSTLGPLPNRAQAAELSSELARLGIPSRLRLETLASITDYWVIQTPEVTADNQQSEIARLRRPGIRDIWPIREGEHSGEAAKARANRMPSAASLSMFGVGFTGLLAASAQLAAGGPDVAPTADPDERRHAGIGQHALERQDALAAGCELGKSYVDDTKLTDHHAILPTGKARRPPAGEARYVYDAVALRLIAAFYTGPEEIDPDILARVSAERLARYKVPRSVRFMDQLPRTAAGKVRKTELRSRHGGES